MTKNYVRLKPNTCLLDIDMGLALFRHFGRLVYVKDMSVKKNHKEFIRSLEIDSLDISKIGRYHKIIEALDKPSRVNEWDENLKIFIKILEQRVDKFDVDKILKVSQGSRNTPRFKGRVYSLLYSFPPSFYSI